MTGPTPLTTPRVRKIGLDAGLVAVGVTSSEVLEPARSLLHRRKEAGLAATMAFTYRNPDRSTDPTSHLPSARSLIAGAWSYREPEPLPAEGPSARPATAGRIARYVWEDHYEKLRTALWEIAHALRAEGHRATVLADTNHLVDRNVAWRAGIGWYGKNANLLVPGVGSWVVLGAVVTSALLEETGPPVDDACGPCRRCLDDCPTNAIIAPGVVDARRCLAWLVQADGSFPVEWREALGDRIYGCDDCQEVCPPNGLDNSEAVKGSKQRHDVRAVDAAGRTVDVEWLLKASDTEILERYGQWYIAERNVDNIRRSALIVLGNTADPSRTEVLELLRLYLKHDQPLLRGHATWAARRLGRNDLAEAMLDDPHPDVRREAAQPVSPRAIQKDQK